MPGMTRMNKSSSGAKAYLQDGYNSCYSPEFARVAIVLLLLVFVLMGAAMLSTMPAKFSSPGFPRFNTHAPQPDNGFGISPVTTRDSGRRAL